MRKNRILHPELSKSLNKLGHTDILLVTDAGFPIPESANRIDLGLYEGMLDIREILKVIRKEVFIEEIHFASDMEERNPDLYSSTQNIFTGTGADFFGTTHEELCNYYAYKSKVIIRSGSFEPFANYALVASTDPFAWFKEGSNTKILPEYEGRRKKIIDNFVPHLR